MTKKLKWIEKYKNQIIFYLVLFLLLLVLNRASVVGSITPFGFSFVFSLALLGKNVLILAPLYFISSIVYNLSIEGLIIVVSTLSALLLLYLIFKILKKKINMASTLIFSMLSQVGYVYFHINSPSEVFTTIVMLIVSMLFIYICYVAFDAIFYRGLQSRFTLDESICFSIFLIAVFSGLHGLYIYQVNITNGIVLFLLLVCSKTTTKTTVIYLSILAGLGMAFASSGVTYIAIYTSFGIVCQVFSGKSKFLAPIAVMVTDVVFGLFLNAYAYYSYLSVIPLLFVSIVFVCLPEKLFAKIKGYSYAYNGSLANEYIVCGQKEMLKDKLQRLCELFKQMQGAYRNLSIGEIDRLSACNALTEELIDMHCKNCPSFEECVENKNIRTAILQLFEFGMEKGRVTIIDANNLITSSCKQLTSMIAEVNQSLVNYFEYEKTVKREDGGKMLVSQQLGGTSNILSELSSFAIGGEKLNEKAAKELLDELTINKVVANETLVLEGEKGIEKVVIIVRNLDVLSPAINHSLRSVFRINFVTIAQKMTKLAGWSILCFVPAPKYSLAVGFSAKGEAPNSPSGDTYSLTKLSETKTLFALADGMGHGKRANQISSVALSLIENFYKCGFTSQTIISSVNNILLPSNEENFTTIDACVVDTSSGTVDFVKVGASASVIKSKDTSRLVVSDNLPLGIVGLSSAKTQKCVLKNQDIVVLATDGIVDVFDSLEDFKNYVNNERVVNVQMLADNILEEAESRNSSHRDDMSVIAIKVSEIV